MPRHGLQHAPPGGTGDRERMLADVRAGLARPQKELAPTWFYDAAGSLLFDRITTLPEYYLTRAERQILLSRADWIAQRFPAATLAELGAGSASKTGVLIEALRRAGGCQLYVPMDVAPRVLDDTARRLRARYPRLHVRPVVADMRDDVSVPAPHPAPVLYAFLGSTIGNFEPPQAHGLLSRIRATLAAGDALLLGTDMIKDPASLEAAYDDAQGVTAEFNRNVLRVLNRELEARFDVDEFEHRALWNPDERRVEMHLVAQRSMTVHVPGAGTFPFRAGESIRTEVSCKYDRPGVERMLADAGFTLDAWMADRAGAFALSLARVTP